MRLSKRDFSPNILTLNAVLFVSYETVGYKKINWQDYNSNRYYSNQINIKLK